MVRGGGKGYNKTLIEVLKVANFVFDLNSPLKSVITTGDNYAG